MPELKNVLVVVGAHPAPHLPKQKYENLVTLYNEEGSIGVATDDEFFNKAIREDSTADIYGFMKGGYYYSSPDSLQEIVDMFNMDRDIEIVTTDSIVKKKSMGAEFIDYQHSEEINDVPFFVTSRLAKEITFESSSEMFKKPLEELVRLGKIIYHIAEPLLTTEVG